MSKEYFYITTPIYYPNSVPHIGHAYTTVVADVLNRYENFFGKTTFFMTGTDEHGQKILEAAKKSGMETMAFVDKIVKEFQDSWKALLVNPNKFIRTSDPEHIKVVQYALKDLFNKGDIYKKGYSGWYCVSEEIFYTEKDLVDGKTPTGKEVIYVTEENYFFKMSKYQDRLIKYINENKNYICPESRRQEVLGFLRNPLSDLCISRPKSRVPWGIELPFDKDYVTYVWFDALINYISGIGFLERENNDFNNFWKESHHLIGKDILTTHAVYWSTMLMALDIPLPKQIFAHGWWLNSESKKMSKSEGDVISPSSLCETFGAEAFRYYMCRGGKFGLDVPFSIDTMKERLNDELANNYGNLVSRSFKIIEKDFEGIVPSVEIKLETSKELIKQEEKLSLFVKENIESFNIDTAVFEISNFLKKVNKYFGDLEPWKCKKQGETQKEAECLYVTLDALRVASILFSPILIDTSKKVLNALSVPSDERTYNHTLTFGKLKAGSKIEMLSPIFMKY